MACGFNPQKNAAGSISGGVCSLCEPCLLGSGLLGNLGLGLNGLNLGLGLSGGLDADEHENLRVDVTVKVDLNLVRADLLDVDAADALAIDGHAKLGLNGVGNLSGGDGAKELALLANLGASFCTVLSSSA